MKRIPLTRGMFAIVDDRDFGRLSKFRWQARFRGNGKCYALRMVYVGKRPGTASAARAYLRGSKSMAEEILGSPPGCEVDHVNGDSLDNRRANLRVATHIQNSRNRKIGINNTSGFKGVSRTTNGKYYARISVGVFDTPEEAARAYDAAARYFYGEFAALNFPEVNQNERGK